MTEREQLKQQLDDALDELALCKDKVKRISDSLYDLPQTLCDDCDYNLIFSCPKHSGDDLD